MTIPFLPKTFQRPKCPSSLHPLPPPSSSSSGNNEHESGVSMSSPVLATNSGESGDVRPLRFHPSIPKLSELEQSVLGYRSQIPADTPLHARSWSEGGRVGESIVVVKDSDYPLTDFRWSMLQMIMEKEIVGGEELKELLQRFLSLNVPHHHDIIVLAFAEI